MTYAASSILKHIQDTKQTDINERYCLSNGIVMNLSLTDITGSRFVIFFFYRIMVQMSGK